MHEMAERLANVGVEGTVGDEEGHDGRRRIDVLNTIGSDAETDRLTRGRADPIRDLVGTVSQHKAEMGLLIVMTRPTTGMIEVAKKSGAYVNVMTGTSYPKVQIVTVADLLAGKRPKMPTAILPYVKAKAYGGDQLTLV